MGFPWISHCYVWLPNGNGDHNLALELAAGTRYQNRHVEWKTIRPQPPGLGMCRVCFPFQLDMNDINQIDIMWSSDKETPAFFFWWLTVATVMLTPNCLEISEWLHNRRISAPWWPVPGPKSGPVHPQYPPIAWTSIWTKLVAKIGTKTVLKHGVLEKKTFIDDCPIRTSVFRVISCQCIFHCHVSALKGTVSFTG